MTETKSKKPTAAAIVAEKREMLAAMPYGEIVAWGLVAFPNRAAYSAFKRAMSAAGMDLDEMKAAGKAARAEALEAKVTHTVTLITDAKASANRWAVCNADGEPVWFSRFSDFDRDYEGHQASAEKCAALKAIWLAGKVAAEVGGVVRLTLKTDAQWLVSLSGKAEELARKAAAAGLVLEMEWIPGTENPADKYTVTNGWMNWKETNLADLAVKL